MEYYDRVEQALGAATGASHAEDRFMPWRRGPTGTPGRPTAATPSVG